MLAPALAQHTPHARPVCTPGTHAFPVRVCFTASARICSGNVSRKERVNVAVIRDKLIPDT